MDEILTLQETAQYLKCHESTIRRYIKQGDFPHFKLGPRAFRFRKSDIDRWIAQKVQGEPIDDRMLVQGAKHLSEPAFAREWDNEKDAAYDQL